jgi:hypothetical protein
VPLLKTHRNEVLAAIQKVGLDPAQFEWSDFEARKEDAVDVLVHTPTNALFYFFFHDNGFWAATWYPSAEGPGDSTTATPY